MLATIMTVVEMHGGSVTAESQGPGEGSQFTVRLPILIDVSKPETSVPLDRGKPKTPHRILIVDDNKDSAESLAMLLSLKGHDVHVAHDGIAALEEAARVRPELILLHIGLPGLNGFEVARTIRERPDVKDAKLVALTGWGQEDYRRRSDEAGFDAHLVKPIAPEDLDRILEMV